MLDSLCFRTVGTSTIVLRTSAMAKIAGQRLQAGIWGIGHYGTSGQQRGRRLRRRPPEDHSAASRSGLRPML